MAVDVGEAETASLVAVGETFVVDAEEMEDGGLEVVYVDRVLGDVVAVFVSAAVLAAALDSAAGHPQ